MSTPLEMMDAGNYMSYPGAIKNHSKESDEQLSTASNFERF